MKDAGISNRETSKEEAREREAYPPVDTSSPPPQDAAGRVGEQPLEDHTDRHTSHKAGSRSIAQKEDGSIDARVAQGGRRVRQGAGRHEILERHIAAAEPGMAHLAMAPRLLL